MIFTGKDFHISDILGSFQGTCCGKLFCICDYAPNFFDTKSSGPRKIQNFDFLTVSRTIVPNLGFWAQSKLQVG